MFDGSHTVFSRESNPPEKQFLFEIVANKRNGIDVDKSVSYTPPHHTDLTFPLGSITLPATQRLQAILHHRFVLIGLSLKTNTRGCY